MSKRIKKRFGIRILNSTFAIASKAKLESKKRPLKSLEKTFKKSVTKFGKQNQSYTFALASKEGQMVEKSVRLKREKNFKYF